MQWIYEIRNPQMIGKAFAEIKKTYIEELPIILPEDTNLITNLVDKLMATYATDDTVNIASLEKQIDDIVYKTYGIDENDLNNTRS
jgi:hypothetical protein